MADRLRPNPYSSYYPRRTSQPPTEAPLGPRKTLLVLVVVVGCFAILWPKVFYPMLVNNAKGHMGPTDADKGCCDVIYELDLDTIQIMTELCSTITDSTGKTPPTPKEMVAECKKVILETCGIDISAVLQERVSLGHSVKQILEEVRSLNGSLCLKYNFGVSPWRLGVPHRININLDPAIRQERPSHLRPDMVHPAFKERGRAIPQPEVAPSPARSTQNIKIVEGRPGPIPGMRPTMGGPGHMVPPSKQSNHGFLGVLMPIYTIGFVVFFTYTVMKLVFKKKPVESYAGAQLYPPVDKDTQFHQEVFEANKNYFYRPNKDNSKIVVNAVSALLEEVNQEIEARKAKTPPETISEQDEIKANGSLINEDEAKEQEIPKITVMAMETRASAESGKKWSRPDSPVLPQPQPETPKEPSSPPPQQIFLEGILPPQSQILVADSATETHKDIEDDSPVVLAGKMTLSVISLDSENGTDSSSNSGKKEEASDEERRTSSSNVSAEFEKISAADLEDQISNIIEEAETIALGEEKRYSLSEELDKFTEEIPHTPHIGEKEDLYDILQEIKSQLNPEDKLIEAIQTTKESEEDYSLPVTDIIKEFLSNEEIALLTESKDIKHIEPTQDITLTTETSPNDNEKTLTGEQSKVLKNDEIEDLVIEKDDNLLYDLERLSDEDEENQTLDTRLTKEEFKSSAIAPDSSLEEPSAFRDKIDELESSNKPQTPDSKERSDSTGSLNKADLLLQGLLVKEDEEIEEKQAAVSGSPSKETALEDSLIRECSREPQSELNLPINNEPVEEKTTEELDRHLEQESKDQEATTEEKTSVSEEAAISGIPSHVVPEEFDIIEQDIEDVVYEDDDEIIEDDDEIIEDEIRNARGGWEDEERRLLERRVNGEDIDTSRNGVSNSDMAAEHEISDEDDLMDEDNEIEEIIEYVDNSDEEGEEIVEINDNEPQQNGEH